MRSLKMLGLTIAAVLAVGIVAVASASAALPEFTGTTFPDTFTSKNLAGVEPTLHGPTSVVCKTSSDTGEITGAQAVAKVVVTYKECKTAGTTTACTTSGQASGTIVTATVGGKVGYVNSATKEVGIELKPATGTEFAKFTCGILSTAVTGCSVGEARPINVLQATGELRFDENAEKNRQKWIKLEGGAECVLSAFGGKAWLSDDESEAFKTAVELKA